MSTTSGRGNYVTFNKSGNYESILNFDTTPLYDIVDWLNDSLTTTVVEQKVLNTFFPSRTINKWISNNPWYSPRGPEYWYTPEKIIPNDIGNKVELTYEYQIYDQQWGRDTYLYIYLMNLTHNKKTLIQRGSGRGKQLINGRRGPLHKGIVDITPFVLPGDKIKLMFTPNYWWSGHALKIYYYKGLNLKYNTNKVVSASNYTGWYLEDLENNIFRIKGYNGAYIKYNSNGSISLSPEKVIIPNGDLLKKETTDMLYNLWLILEDIYIDQPDRALI